MVNTNFRPMWFAISYPIFFKCKGIAGYMFNDPSPSGPGTDGLELLGLFLLDMHAITKFTGNDVGGAAGFHREIIAGE